MIAITKAASANLHNAVKQEMLLQNLTYSTELLIALYHNRRMAAHRKLDTTPQLPFPAPGFVIHA
jgi:hypothetical protein